MRCCLFDDVFGWLVCLIVCCFCFFSFVCLFGWLVVCLIVRFVVGLFVFMSAFSFVCGLVVLFFVGVGLF